MKSALSTLTTLLFSSLLCTATAIAEEHGSASQTPAQSTQSFNLIRVTPDGDTHDIPNQIVLQFDRPVVPLGRMERTDDEISIEVTPRLQCSWRWLNTSALACFLNEADLPKPATHYTISIPQEFDSTRGAILSTAHTYSFTTPRPTISSASFRRWSGPGKPIFDLNTNYKVPLDSLKQHLALVDAAGKSYELSVEPFTPESEDDFFAQHPELYQGRKWLATPIENLPLDSAATLKLLPGLKGEVGELEGEAKEKLRSFMTFPQFSILGVECNDRKGNFVSLKAHETAWWAASKTPRCDPLSRVRLIFSAPVNTESLQEGVTSVPDLRGGRTDFDPWDNAYAATSEYSAPNEAKKFNADLPYALKANTSYTINLLAKSLKDEFGRSLDRDSTITILTDNRNSRLVLDNPISVLEKETDSKLPVVVNNLSALNLSYQMVTTDGAQEGIKKTLYPYNARNIAYPFPIDVRELLGGRSGVVQGKLSSAPNTTDGSQWFFSQVTPYNVHAKIGHANSLVWVTSMSTGKPVSDATVSISVDNLTALSSAPPTLASATTDARGVATLPGTRVVDPSLTLSEQWNNAKPRLFVRVQKDNDYALLPISWDFKVYADNIWPRTRTAYGHIHAWGTTAQGLYKVGDSVQFALWVRDQNINGFVPAPRDGYKLEVRDPTGKVVYTVPSLKLSEFGSFNGEFSVKKDAAVGWYSFVLSSTFSRQSWHPLRVLISDFTPASFKVSSELGKKEYNQDDTVTLTTEARLHAGGPYSDAAVRITASVVNGPITPTIPGLANFTFDSGSGERQFYQQEEKLDNKGNHTSTFAIPALDTVYGTLFVESAVRDDRGKFVTTTSRAPYSGRDRFVGLAQRNWILTAKKEAVVDGVVLNAELQPTTDHPFTIKIEYKDTKAARVKSAGNSYTTRYESTWNEVKRCELRSTISDASCTFVPEKTGAYRMVAEVLDEKQRKHTTSIERWAAGSDNVLWESNADTNLNITPERNSYKVGEKARFLIKNPFPGALALITTERLGVQRSWVQTLKSSTEVFEVEVTKDHIPGFFFSATVVSPRVAKPIENQVDLGKPAFRSGYAQIQVDDSVKKLTLNVTPRAKSYKPRETVTVDIAVQGPLNSKLLKPVELAVTVLDESVFDLIQQGKTYFDPYQGFYSLDGLDVRNFNLIKMLVGRQKFEKKGANPGGDGGSNLDMRSLQKFVSYWNPSLRPDRDGRATISFEAPDNLTGWKVFAVAVSKDELMGLGEGSFTVTKQTEVRSALPNQVRVGDEFKATFTVTNRSDANRKLNVTVSTEGESVAKAAQNVTIDAEPFKRYPVSLTTTASAVGEARIVAKAHDAQDGDMLLGTVQVLPRITLRTAATFGSAEAAPIREPVSFPAGLEPGVGSVGVVLSPSILGGLEGAFTYMKEYPYDCWEQKLSKGLMAAHSISLQRYLPKSFQWQEAEKVVASVLKDISAHQAPNGGMSFYIPQDEYVNPYLSGYTALALTWLRDRGYSIPENEEQRLHDYLRSIMRNDVFADWVSSGLKSSVRAVALSALARGGKIQAKELLRYSEVFKEMTLFGKAHYLDALVSLNADGQATTDVLNNILSSGSEAGSSYTLAESSGATSNFILDSSMRSQCAVLSALLRVGGTPESPLGKKVVPIIPKLVRSITVERKRKDRWENTQENVFCMNALAEYSAAYEKTQPRLDLGVSVGEESLANVSFKEVTNEPIEVSRTLRAIDSGAASAVAISASGVGRYYYSTRLTYALQGAQTSAINSGIELSREYSVKRGSDWKLLGGPIEVRQGELVKVDLFLRLSTPRYFVVVNDPIPGGLEPVNRDLKTASAVDASQEGFSGPLNSLWFTYNDWVSFGATFWSFYHKELRHSSARFFSEYLPAGNYHLSYVSQAIAPGEFITLPAHAEEMYDPDVFGDSKGDRLRVTAPQ